MDYGERKMESDKMESVEKGWRTPVDKLKRRMDGSREDEIT
jgi:hypothetical protein